MGMPFQEEGLPCFITAPSVVENQRNGSGHFTGADQFVSAEARRHKESRSGAEGSRGRIATLSQWCVKVFPEYRLNSVWQGRVTRSVVARAPVPRPAEQAIPHLLLHDVGGVLAAVTRASAA